MNKKLWIVGPALVAMLVGSGVSQAQPGAAGATAGNPTNRKGKAAKAKRQPLITPGNLAKILGQPLTPDQKKAVNDAVKTYNESIAKAVGLTPEDLATKAKAYRDAQGAGKKAAG